LFVRDGLHLACAEGLDGVGVVSQVELGADEDDGDIGGVMFDLGEPLFVWLSELHVQIGRISQRNPRRCRCRCRETAWRSRI
jgi:hypothetical protein